MTKETKINFSPHLDSIQIMGIVNITDDSFSGDGLLGKERDALLKQVDYFLNSGSRLIDIGGESSRPGAIPLDEDEEAKRVIPVVQLLKETWPDIILSVDTRRANIAEGSLRAGASIINDITGLGHDPRMAEIVKDYDCDIVLMHNKARWLEYETISGIGRSYSAKEHPNFMDQLLYEMQQLIEQALGQGIAYNKIITDPGFGFGKTPNQNLLMLKNLDQMKSLCQRLLIGTSRKSFIGRVLNRHEDQRLSGSLASVAHSILNFSTNPLDELIFRVHDVGETHDLIQMIRAIQNSADDHDKNIPSAKITEIFISIGSNLGERSQNIDRAIAALTEVVSEIKISPKYETKPQYVTDQPAFLNCAIHGKTNLPPETLLAALKNIEKIGGRKKGKIRFGPREIDLDIVYYGQNIISHDQLEIPHPRRLERQFVLKPLADLSPHWRDCISGLTVERHLKNLETAQEDDDIRIWPPL